MVETTFRENTRATVVEWLLDPAAAYRMRRVSLRDGVEKEPFFVDEITLDRNAEGVWRPSSVRRHPQPYSRRAMRLRGGSVPAASGSLESSSTFTDFTTQPEIPADAFAAIPAEGSAAYRAALAAESASPPR